MRNKERELSTWLVTKKKKSNTFKMRNTEKGLPTWLKR